MARVAIEQLGHVEFEIEPAFGSGHEALLFRGLDDPLPVLAVAGEVHLDRLGMVVLRVLAQHLPGMLQALDAVGPEADPGAGGVNPRTCHQACFHHVPVCEHVGSSGLRVAGRRDAVGQVCLIDPDIVFVDAPVGPHVRVGVHEAGDDGFTTGIYDFGPCGHF